MTPRFDRVWRDVALVLGALVLAAIVLSLLGAALYIGLRLGD